MREPRWKYSKSTRGGLGQGKAASRIRFVAPCGSEVASGDALPVHLQSVLTQAQGLLLVIRDQRTLRLAPGWLHH